MNIAEFVKSLTNAELHLLGKAIGQESLERGVCVIKGINDAGDSPTPGGLFRDRLGAWHLSQSAESFGTVAFREARHNPQQQMQG